MAKRITEYIDTPKGGGISAQKQLRQLVARYPYYQAARILLLRTLFEAHDPTFGQELRRAALFVPSRKVLYQLIESKFAKPTPDSRVHHRISDEDIDDTKDRTYSLIDNFLNTNLEPQPRKSPVRHALDATNDYMGYLLQIEADMGGDKSLEDAQLLGQPEIDDFLKQRPGKITIQEHPEEELQKPEIETSAAEKGEIFTETLARIYIKQAKYDKALEIIQRLSLKYPKKNRYFADQIRYLEKLIVNNNNK